MGIVYIVINKVNGKRYVGKTVYPLKFRRRHHENDSKKSRLPFHNALRKYGFDQFTWQVCFNHTDESVLFEKEKRLIRLLKTRGPAGYNLTDGGEGITGYRHTEAVKRQIKAQRLGTTLTEEIKVKIRASTKLTMSTPEYKAKAGLAQKGLVKSESHRRNLAAAKLGDLNPTKRPEVRAKISKALTGRKLSEKCRLKISLSLTGIKRGPLCDKVRKAVIESNRKRHSILDMSKLMKSFKRG